MEAHIDKSNQVPITNIEEMSLKTENPTNHSLGLQDLYKAAFSQEPGFNNFEKATIIEDPLTMNGLNQDEKPEIVYKNELEDTYHLYTLKSIPYVEFRAGDGKEIKMSDLNYDCRNFETKQDFPEVNLNTAVLQSYENEDTNSVLDLDKGIQIQVVKVNNDGFNYPFDQKNYPGDSQILHRYLCDSAFLKSDSNDVSNPSSGQDDSFQYIKQSNNDFFDEKGVGVNPNALGVRFEDCDFNSSDSFASTESIIPKNIKCPKCPKKFMFKSDLLRHDKYKHSVKSKLTCKYCSKEFASQQNLVFHEKSHKKKPGSKCETCKKVFKKPGFLVKHMMKKHSKSLEYHCEICGKGFPSEFQLRNHLKKNHEGTTFHCGVCQKRFETKQALNCHAKTHSEVFTCDICQKSFAKGSSLKAHLKTHEDKDGFVCEVCDKDCKSKGGLEEHSRTHSKDKPFLCDVCFKSFANKSYFKVHIRKHLDKKPFECASCEKSFVTATDLSKHERSHTKEKPYVCVNCNQGFSQQCNLITHWKKHRCNAKTQEICTQTVDFETLTADKEVLGFVTAENLPNIQNVNVVVNNFSTQQPILLTSIGGFLNSNSVPIILAPSPSESVPYSLSSIQS